MWQFPAHAGAKTSFTIGILYRNFIVPYRQKFHMELIFVVGLKMLKLKPWNFITPWLFITHKIHCHFHVVRLCSKFPRPTVSQIHVGFVEAYICVDGGHRFSKLASSDYSPIGQPQTTKKRGEYHKLVPSVCVRIGWYADKHEVATAARCFSCIHKHSKLFWPSPSFSLRTKCKLL